MSLWRSRGPRALGLPLGVFLAAIVTEGLSGYGRGFDLPIAPLVVFTIVAALAGVLASIPARPSLLSARRPPRAPV